MDPNAQRALQRTVALAKAQYTEGQHPRHPKGSPKGGEFAPKAGGGATLTDYSVRYQQRSSYTEGRKEVRGPNGDIIGHWKALDPSAEWKFAYYPGGTMDGFQTKFANTREELQAHANAHAVKHAEVQAALAEEEASRQKPATRARRMKKTVELAKATFEEAEHPRAQNGKFAPKGKYGLSPKGTSTRHAWLGQDIQNVIQGEAADVRQSASLSDRDFDHADKVMLLLEDARHAAQAGKLPKAQAILRRAVVQARKLSDRAYGQHIEQAIRGIFSEDKHRRTYNLYEPPGNLSGVAKTVAKASANWDEAKHPRDGGKFAPKAGAGDDAPQPHSWNTNLRPDADSILAAAKEREAKARAAIDAQFKNPKRKKPKRKHTIFSLTDKPKRSKPVVPVYD